MRNFLLVYVTFMVAVSTVNTITLMIVFAIGRNIFKMDTGIEVVSLADNELRPDTFPNRLAGALCQHHRSRFIIATRIKKIRQKIQTDGLGPSTGSPYTTFMEIWVESAALTILFSIVYLVLAMSNSNSSSLD